MTRTGKTGRKGKNPCDEILQTWDPQALRRSPDLRRLLKSAADWDIHNGICYQQSSSFGLNFRPAIQSGTGLPDTAHDMHDVSEFTDLMNSRSRQAMALARDMMDFNDLMFRAGDIYPTAKKALMENYADRFVMAMYGVDERVHAATFKSIHEKAGQQPYLISRRQVLRRLENGDVKAMAEKLRDFSDTWAGIAEKDLVRQEAGEKPVCLVTNKANPGKAKGAVYTQDFLERYIAELKGHEAFFDKAGSLWQQHPGMRMDGPKGAVDYNPIQRILETCRDENTGRGQSARVYAMDGEGLVRTVHADMDREAQAGKPVKAVDKTAPEPNLVSKSRPRRRGLDAKAAEIEAGNAGVDMNAYRALMAGRYGQLSVGMAGKTPDELQSDMALAYQEQAELGD